MTTYNYPHMYVTRYMGAKYKLLDLIIPEIYKLLSRGGTVVDLMSGTQSIGYALKKDFKIVSNDVQYYAQVFGHALLVNNEIRNVRHDFKEDFSDLNINQFSNSWFVHTYKNTYFSEKQSMQIAAIRSRIKDVSDKTKQSIYLTALATAMSTCQSSSGHFAQYMPKEHPRIRALRQMDLFQYFQEKCMEIEIFISNYRNVVFGKDGVELLQSSELKSCAPPGSLVYLDPPYSSAQYSRYYHLLETVFLDDEPEVDFKGLYRPNRFQSDFSSPKKVTDAFEKVIKFSSLSNYNLIISYSDGGLIALDKLRNICSNYYSTVELKYELYPHSMQGRGQLNDRHEVIVVSSNS